MNFSQVVLRKEVLPMENTTTRTGGFAKMDRAKQREIARKGGMAAHQKGTAHEFTAEEARFAGRKGGQQVSANRSHMIEIGRLGGKRSAEKRRQRALKQAPAKTSQTDQSDTTQSDDENDAEMRQQGLVSVGDLTSDQRE